MGCKKKKEKKHERRRATGHDGARVPCTQTQTLSEPRS